MRETTEKQDLRSGEPLWLSTPRISVRARARAGRNHYDVIIVGSGVSGALMAHALADGRKRILMLDRRKPVRGSTIASTAMIQHEIDVPLHQLARRIGKEKAKRAWLRSARAVEDLIELCRETNIACQMQPKKALYLSGDEFGSRALETEARMRGRIGLDAEFIGAETLRDQFGIDRTGAILSTASASANPGQLTAGLIRIAQKKGLVLASPVEITDVLPVGDRVAMATSDGNAISASHVVFCTGYEFLDRLRNRNHSVISTWALAARPSKEIPRWLQDYLVWEASDPYLYLRMSDQGFLIAGGEDEADPEAHRDPVKLKRKTTAILKKAERLLGVKIAAPDYAWSALFGTTTTGLPMIGEAPGMPNVHAVMGFGGNGITFSMIASQIVAADILGKADADRDLFGFV